MTEQTQEQVAPRRGMSQYEKDFTKGYVCALSCIVSGHGSDVTVEESLIAGCISYDSMVEAGCDPLDFKQLEEPLRFIGQWKSNREVDND